MKAFEKLKRRLIGYVHIQSGLWLKNKGLVITSENSSTNAPRNVLPTVERTPLQKLIDETNYKINRQLKGLPMPELRITRQALGKDGKPYWMGFGWWYPPDWDFEIGGTRD